jgi:hypothetical protein
MLQLQSLPCAVANDAKAIHAWLRPVYASKGGQKIGKATLMLAVSF